MLRWHHCALIGLLCVLLPAAALGGPWPRGAGKVFFAADIAFDHAHGQARLGQSDYIEYGLSDRFTLGGSLRADSGWTEAAVQPILLGLEDAPIRLRAFLRWHLGEVMPQSPAALEVQVSSNPEFSADRVRLAGHLGRGFSVLDRDGWARLGVSAGIAGPLRDGQRDATLQLGLEAWQGMRIWVDGAVSVSDGDPLPRLGVTTALDFGQRYTVTIGYGRSFGNWREAGGRIGLWAEF